MRTAEPLGAGKKSARKKAAPPTPEAIRSVLVELQKRGFNRLYQDGRVHEFSSPETLLDVNFAKPVWVLVDRLAVNPESRSWLVASTEICFCEAGVATLEFLAAGR